MQKVSKIYIPIDIKQTSENGVVLIATGKTVVSDERAVITFIKEHLREIENVYIYSNEEHKQQVDLLADLRNKLSPIKNYLALTKELEKIQANPNSNHFEQERLELKLKNILKEQLQISEEYFFKVESIIKKLEEK